MTKAHLLKREICEFYGIQIKDLTGTSRKAHKVEARHIAMSILLRHTKLGCVRVGKMFNRDHSTVLYAYDKIKDEISYNERLRKKFNYFEEFFLKNEITTIAA